MKKKIQKKAESVNTEKARAFAKADRDALFLAIDELSVALRNWLNTDITFLEKGHDFNRGEMLASGIAALVPLLEDAERRSGTEVAFEHSVLQGRIWTRAPAVP